MSEAEHQKEPFPMKKFDRTLKEQLAQLIHQNSGEWDHYLPADCQARVLLPQACKAQTLSIWSSCVDGQSKYTDKDT